MSVKQIQAIIEKIRDRRKSLGISQEELAQLCDLSKNGISKFENSNGNRDIKLSTLIKISEVLGFKISLDFEQ